MATKKLSNVKLATKPKLNIGSYYHVKLEFSGSPQYWWDLSKEKLQKMLLIPFINGQVIVVHRGGLEMVLNMKSASLLTVFGTKSTIGTKAGVVPVELTKITPEFAKNDCTSRVISEVQGSYSNPQAQSLLQLAFAPPQPQIFVIMKFSEKALDSAYDGVIKPIIEEFNLKALRIDEIQDAGKITDQVLQQIAMSKYVFADLSGERPNCYYETGFAHALGKPLILTIRKSDAVHFDLAGYRFIQWETESELRTELRKRLVSMEQNTSA